MQPHGVECLDHHPYKKGHIHESPAGSLRQLGCFEHKLHVAMGKKKSTYFLCHVLLSVVHGCDCSNPYTFGPYIITDGPL